jgi:hypothetical protein
VELERQQVELERQQVDLDRRELSVGDETAAAPYAVAAQVDEVVTVTTAPGTGPNGSNAAPVKPEGLRRSLKDLPDEELDKRIDLLDRRLEQSRKHRIARYARAEKALAELTGKPLVKPVKKVDKVKPVVRPDHDEPRKAVPKRSGVKALQRALNKFSEKYLDGLVPLEVDGKKGTETDKRIRTVKYYLGYGGAERRSTAVPAAFLRRLRHPRSPRYSGPGMLMRAAARRRKQRARAKKLAVGPIEGTPKHIVDGIVLPIAQQCGINRSVAENDAANARHGPTNTGGTSDHQGPGHVAWAADISNGGSPTPEMDKLARRLADRFDIPWSGSGLVTATHGGYRYQLIYRTMQGGNHFNHVHFGVRDV